MSKTIPEIVGRMSRKFPHMIYIGREYTVADLIREIEEYDREMQERVVGANVLPTERIKLT